MELTIFQTASLGELTKALEEVDRLLPVEFDFEHLVPGMLASYRGYYEHLAIAYNTPDNNERQVKDLLNRLRIANDEIFEGWKGGLYRMGRDTPVWVANPGECRSTTIIGVREDSRRIVILTSTATD